MVLLDLREFDEELTGKLAKKCSIAPASRRPQHHPDDPRSPFVTSGLRVGSAAANDGA